MTKQLVWICLLIVACKKEAKQPVAEAITDPVPVEIVKFEPEYTAYEDSLLSLGFVDLARQDSSIVVDLKYATSDNFLDTILYTDIQHAFAVAELAGELKLAGEILRKTHPGHSFLVFDCLRPRSVQRKMWQRVVNTPQEKYVAAPTGSGSMHNYGCAIDLTIINASGKPIDMGTNYDHFGPAAEYRYNWELLKKGELTQQQVDNRMLLRQTMRAAGFHSIDSEWWHFNLSNREYIRANYTLIE